MGSGLLTALSNMNLAWLLSRLAAFVLSDMARHARAPCLQVSLVDTPSYAV